MIQENTIVQIAQGSHTISSDRNVSKHTGVSYNPRLFFEIVNLAINPFVGSCFE